MPLLPSPPGMSGAASTAAAPPIAGGKSYAWLLAWLLFIGLLAVAMQTKIGYAFVYYSLVLILVFLLLTQYQFIAAAFAPLGQPAPSNG